MYIIRLKPIRGKRKQCFHVVSIDSRYSVSSNKYKFKLGYLNKHTKEFKIDIDKYKELLSKGAKTSKTVWTWVQKQYNI